MTFWILSFVSPILANSILQLPEVEGDGKLFAVLVAGSDGWYNYRHQVSILENNYYYYYQKRILFFFLVSSLVGDIFHIRIVSM